MNRIVPAAALAALLSSSASRAADEPGTDVPDAVKGITARELGGHMKFLASDLMRGRDTASPETRLAAEYLASRLSAAGAEPAGESEGGKKGYFQPFPLEVITPQLEGTSLSLTVEQNGAKRVIPCKVGEDLTLFPFGLAPGDIDAPVVFAGYGIVNEAEKVDDYAGIDVKDRFVLVFDGMPPKKKDDGKAADAPAPKAQTKGRNRSGTGGFNSFAKRETAARAGALGLIIVRPPGSDPANPPNRPFGFGRSSMSLGHAETSIPVLTLSDRARDGILVTTDPAKPRLADGVRAHFTFAARKEAKEDRNVVGLFPGSDPDRAKEVVIFSAHYDHVGVDDKGVIFNGSDDNASGTSGLLEMAEAFGDGPKPARSIAFLWVSGEEKGLFGSEWFSDHISLPDGYKIVADINLDMISRNDGKQVGVTPSDKHPDYSTLIPAARSACEAEGLAIKFDADQYYGRTDSFNFARKGIPVIFFFAGVHGDYHQSTDDVEKADFDKAARIARAAYRLGWRIAQAEDVPKKIKAEAATKPAEGR